jgi:hypothetical protein
MLLEKKKKQMNGEMQQLIPIFKTGDKNNPKNLQAVFAIIAGFYYQQYYFQKVIVE